MCMYICLCVRVCVSCRFVSCRILPWFHGRVWRMTPTLLSHLLVDELMIACLIVFSHFHSLQTTSSCASCSPTYSGHSSSNECEKRQASNGTRSTSLSSRPVNEKEDIQERYRSGWMDLDNWFIDPFNFGFGKLGRRFLQDDTTGQDVLWQHPFRNSILPHNSGLLTPFQTMDTLINTNMKTLGSFTPSMKLDIKETEKEYTCTLDMPGVTPKDLDLEWDEQTRTIHVQVHKGQEKETQETVQGQTIHRMERASGTGYRSIRMPPTVDLQRIQADLKDGVLVLSVPKREATSGRNRIPLGEQKEGVQAH